jgi:hypothetical protein
MQDLERAFYRKINKNFADEIATLDKCLVNLIKKTPLLHRPALKANLLSARPQVRRSVSQLLLMYHANMFLQAARLLLLNEYPAPSMSCLRSTVESILNAHVCKQSDEKATEWVKGEEINRKGFRYPRQFPKKTAKKIMDEMGAQGVHPSFWAFLAQAFSPNVAFSEENKREYEFHTLRLIYFCLFISSRFLQYALNKRPALKKEFPEAINIAQDLAIKTNEIGTELEEDLKQSKKKR